MEKNITYFETAESVRTVHERWEVVTYYDPPELHTT